MRPNPRLLATMLLVLAGLQGCTGTTSFQIEAVAFNPQLRTDLQPLTADQRVFPDPGFGPYRIGNGELVSPLYPVSSVAALDGRTSNLVQSQCLWLGHNSQLDSGDRVEFSWEQVWTFANEPGHPVLPAAERSFGMCDYNNPVSRVLANSDGTNALGTGLEAGSATLYVSTSGRSLRVSDTPPPLTGQNFISTCMLTSGSSGNDNGLHCEANGTQIYGTQLVKYQNTAPDSAVNADGTCNPGRLRTGRTVFDGSNEAVAPAVANRHLPICAIRGQWQPDRDTSLELVADFWQPNTVIDLGPNLMVVDALRSIRRVMTRVQRSNPPSVPPNPGFTETWTWNTASQSASGRVRWEENFSPSINVTRATVRLRRGGSALPISVTAPLCISSDGGRSCRYSCRPAAQPSGAAYELSAIHCTDRFGRPATPELTPTYDIGQLDPTPGNPQTTPLQWILRGQPVLATGDVVQLEFDLLARVARGAALTADHSGFDFGRVQQGSGAARMETTLRNVGDTPIRLDRITVLGTHPNDFSLLLPELAKPVPLPLDVLPLGSTGKFTVAPGRDFGAQPLLRLDTSKKGLIGALLPALRYAPFRLYERPLEVVGGLLVTRDPGFDFIAAGRQQSLAEHPELASAEAYAAGRHVYASAHTLRTLPSVLRPGEYARVSLTARPTGLGARTALLRIDATPIQSGSLLPPIQLPLRLQSVSGAILDALPTALSFPRHRGGQPGWRSNFLVNNVGELRGAVATVDLQGAHAHVFSVSTPATPFALDPGQVEILTVHAQPPRCGAVPSFYEAEVVLKLNDGGTATVRLSSTCMP